MGEIATKKEAKGIQSGESTLCHNTGKCIYYVFTTGALIPVRNSNYGGKVRYGYNCPGCGCFIPATFSADDMKELDKIYAD